MKNRIDPDSDRKLSLSGDNYQRIENADVIKFECFK